MTEADRPSEAQSKIEMPFSSFPQEGMLEKLFPEWRIISVQEGDGRWMLAGVFQNGEVSLDVDKRDRSRNKFSVTKVRKDESSQITDRQSYTICNPGFVELTFNEEDPGKNLLKVNKNEKPNNRVEVGSDGRLLICISDSETLFVGFDQ